MCTKCVVTAAACMNMRQTDRLTAVWCLADDLRCEEKKQIQAFLCLWERICPDVRSLGSWQEQMEVWFITFVWARSKNTTTRKQSSDVLLFCHRLNSSTDVNLLSHLWVSMATGWREATGPCQQTCVLEDLWRNKLLGIYSIALWHGPSLTSTKERIHDNNVSLFIHEQNTHKKKRGVWGGVKLHSVFQTERGFLVRRGNTLVFRAHPHCFQLFPLQHLGDVAAWSCPNLTVLCGHRVCHTLDKNIK